MQIIWIVIKACVTCTSLGSSFLLLLSLASFAASASMPVRKKATKMKSSKFLRLTPLQRGMIFMGFLAGSSLQDIADDVEKQDGSHPSTQAVSDTIALAKANGGSKWNGEVHGDAGRPRETSSKLDQAIRKLVFQKRGSIKVTAKVVRKLVVGASKLSLRSIQRRISEAGLAYLRRRRKHLVSPAHKQERLEWVAWVYLLPAAMLARWAYTDGTSFYLARTQDEHGDKKRLALGTHVWRAANGHDALYEDCVGPSCYAKAQGKCVRIWGLLFAGILCIFVLPDREAMNTAWYTWLIEHKFRNWLDAAFARTTKVFLVQDHERCLWAEEPVDAMEDENIELLDNFPTSSQDLNPIEVAWREVRSRLDATMPAVFESRPAFLRRLRQAVAWVNSHRACLFHAICGAQKAWAQDVLDASPPGARTKH
jgi:hypothetical protein